MSFFYDLNKKLDGIRATPEVTHKQLNERDEGKPGKNFAKIAKDAGERYGSKAAGERVAGAVRNKLKSQGKLEEEGMSRAAKGYEKYGKEGMEALAKAGRDGKALDPVRKKYDKYDNTEVDEGMMDAVKSVGKRVAGGINRLVGHGSDEDMRRDVQRKMGAKGAQVHGKKSMTQSNKGVSESDLGHNVVRYYEKTQDVKKLTNWLEKNAGLPRNSPLYFDDVDLVYGNKTIVPGALINPKLTFNDLLNAVVQASKQGMAEEDGAPMTAKQKSFAKLAPPADKITFADKIAGAKKEVDEMLGDVAAEAMRSALSGGQKKLDKNQNGKLDANDFAMLRKGAKKGHSGEMDEEKSKGTAFDMSAPRAATPKVGSVERGHKHDIKHTATGRMVTRRTDDQGNSVGADDASDAQAGPRGRGRPKGTKGAIGAKGPSGRSKLMTKENDVDPTDQGEYDREGEMAKDDIKTVVRHAQALQKILGDNDNLPEWVQSKLAKIEGMMISIDEYMQNQTDDDEMSMGEEKTNQRDNHAEKAGKKVTKDVEYDEKKKDGIHGKKRGSEDAKAEKAGKKVTKDIEYDEKKKDKEVDESTTSGSVAASTATKSGGGSMVGKGIYDSLNRELEKMISESMTINMSDSTEGGKSLTITATDEDAMKLGMMLKNAGLGGGDAHGGDMHSPGEEPCDTCGMPDCGCGDVQEAVDENAPDWPTNTETSPDALQYSGGLNKPKTDVAGDGQTTIPNTAVHTQDEDALRRMMEMAGIKQAELEPWEQTMKEDAAEDATDAENDAEAAEAETEVQEDFLESIQRMREIAGIKEAKKPDFLDMDKDGDKKEPMSKAVKDKDEKKVDESIFALTNQWKAYKG
jgi:hypothetical protein